MNFSSSSIKYCINSVKFLNSVLPSSSGFFFLFIDGNQEPVHNRNSLNVFGLPLINHNKQVNEKTPVKLYNDARRKAFKAKRCPSSNNFVAFAC